MHLGKPAEVLAFSAIHRYAYLQTIPEQAVVTTIDNYYNYYTPTTVLRLYDCEAQFRHH